jgi:hypothetical protein
MRTERGVPVAFPFAWERGFVASAASRRAFKEVLWVLSKNPAPGVAFAPSL